MTTFAAVSPAGAVAQDPPSQPPTTVAALTAPPGGSIVRQTLPIVAASAAAIVQFAVDGVNYGSPVAVSGGYARKTWDTYGLPGGQHEVSAADCNAFGCSTPSSGTYLVQNEAPSITSPASSGVVSNAVRIQIATADPVPQVRLSVDGSPVGAPVAVSNGKAAISWASAAVANRSHTLVVSSCSSAGACGGESATVQVAVRNAAPVVTSPTAGQVVARHATFTATGPAGGKLFRLDGAVIGFDAVALRRGAQLRPAGGAGTP